MAFLNGDIVLITPTGKYGTVEGIQGRLILVQQDGKSVADGYHQHKLRHATPNEIADRARKLKRAEPGAAKTIRDTAARKRDPAHADTELIEEVKVPAWLGVAIQTDRPQLVGVGAPLMLDETDTVLTLNLVRVLMETNQSLRRRLVNKNAVVDQALKDAAEAADHASAALNAARGLRMFLENNRPEKP